MWILKAALLSWSCWQIIMRDNSESFNSIKIVCCLWRAGSKYGIWWMCHSPLGITVPIPLRMPDFATFFGRKGEEVNLNIRQCPFHLSMEGPNLLLSFWLWWHPCEKNSSKESTSSIASVMLVSLLEIQWLWRVSILHVQGLIIIYLRLRLVC